MRSVLVAILVTSAAFLAGCSDKGDGHEDHYACPDGTELDLEEFPDHHNDTFNPLAHCPKGGSGTNTTGSAPNVLPTLVLTTTDDGGNVTNVTMLDGNLTFSAEGSTDSDGSITGIAVSVTDSNTTRTASLYDAATKSFKSASFNFDRAGVVRVTVAMVDDRAGFTVNQSKVYVDEEQQIGGANVQLPAPPAGMETCGGMDDLLEASFYKEFTFAVVDNATWVEASSSNEAAELTICGPKAEGEDTSEVLSDSGNPVETTEGVALPAAGGVSSYYIAAVLSDPTGANSAVPVTVIVHYGPRPAAAA
jgi:hypothetical protein